MAGGRSELIRALALTGPTASGKTAISLSLAERIGAEIISCDSMQIYKGMDIGTAKATPSERAAVPHHMLDIIAPNESYSAEDYRRDSLAVARDIASLGKWPLFVGGTGLYIDTVMRAAPAESPPSDPIVRERLGAIAAEQGVEALWKRLCEVDPESAEKTHANNLRRVIRALEIYEVSGKTKSYFDRLSREAVGDADVFMMTLDFHNRETLYRRVDERVDVMMREGLLSEVESLWRGGLLDPANTSAQAIGYKEIVRALQGECSLGDAVEEIKLSSRRYAKRQLTWFRHEENAVKIYVDNEDGSLRTLGSLADETTELALSRIRKWSENESDRA